MWIELTDIEGRPVWVNTEHCVRVRTPDRDAEGAGAHIDMLAGSMAVRETIDEIVARLKGTEF
jgi:uncharacterized protein YlzI (FlbEa/FlbD family)